MDVNALPKLKLLFILAVGALISLIVLNNNHVLNKGSNEETTAYLSRQPNTFRHHARCKLANLDQFAHEEVRESVEPWIKCALHMHDQLETTDRQSLATLFDGERARMVSDDFGNEKRISVGDIANWRDEHGFHKTAAGRMPNTMTILSADNTVIVADTRTCRVTKIFPPTRQGQVDGRALTQMQLVSDRPKPPKSFPCVSPSRTLLIAGLAYQSKSSTKSFLRTHLPGFRVVSTRSPNGYKAWALLDKFGNLFFTFRGVFNAKSVASVVILNPIQKKFAKWVRKVTKVYGNPYMLVGHSAGGHFAADVKCGGNPWRVTFNAFWPDAGRKTMNLDSKKDWLYGGGNDFLIEGTGGHSIEAFVAKFTPLTTPKSWNKVHPAFARRGSCSPRLKSCVIPNGRIRFRTANGERLDIEVDGSWIKTSSSAIYRKDNCGSFHSFGLSGLVEESHVRLSWVGKDGMRRVFRPRVDGDRGARHLHLLETRWVEY